MHSFGYLTKYEDEPLPKKYQYSEDITGIFKASEMILKREKEGYYEYRIDGLIYLPVRYSVKGSIEGSQSKYINGTWDYNFKWKPPEFNTIDFLVTTQKSETGEDKVGNIFQKGTDLSSAETVSEYKTLILRVGFDEKQHGYINPCQNVIDDSYDDIENKDKNFNTLEKIRPESVLLIEGSVVKRSEETINKDLKTGSIEIKIKNLDI